MALKVPGHERVPRGHVSRGHSTEQLHGIAQPAELDIPIQHDVVGDDVGVGDVRQKQAAGVGEGSAGEVGVEERVL